MGKTGYDERFIPSAEGIPIRQVTVGGSSVERTLITQNLLRESCQEIQWGLLARLGSISSEPLSPRMEGILYSKWDSSSVRTSGKNG